MDRERMINFMAIAAINWAYRQQGLTPTEKFVLVTLADRANASEWMCWPSVRDLCERTGLHRASVMRALQKLVDNDLVIKGTRMRDQGGYSSCTYTLNRPPESAFSDVAQRDIAMSQCETTPVAQCDTAYIEEPSTEPSIINTKRVTEKMCVEVYDLYPRKRGRGAALKAIKKAIKHIGFDELKDAVKQFAAEWQTRLAAGEDMTFCPWPQRWFNEQRYLDQEEPTPQAAATKQATQPKKPQSVWELKQLRDTLQEDARQIRLRYCAEEAHFTAWDSEAKKAEYHELMNQVKALNIQLKALAGSDQEVPSEPISASVSSLVAAIASKNRKEGT